MLRLGLLFNLRNISSVSYSQLRYLRIYNQHLIKRFNLFTQIFYFHTSNNLNAKLFIDRENKYAHSILKNVEVADEISSTIDIISYDELNNILDQDFTNKPTDVLVDTFRQISQYSEVYKISLSDKIFDKLIVAILKKCRSLTDNELADLLLVLQKWPQSESLNSHNFGDLWSALDDMCIKRMKEWPIDKLLYFADLWYMLNLTKVGDYVFECIKQLSRKPSRLTPKQLVKLLFFINVNRKSPLNMIDLEYRMGKCIEQLSLDELAVVCMGFFKSQTTIKDINIISHLIDRVTANTETIHEITLCSIMKAIRYSSHLTIVDKLKKLLDKLALEIDRLSILSCVHIALVNSNSHSFHLETLTRISKRFVENIDSVRLKDIERLTFMLTLFNFTPDIKDDIYEVIVKSLNKRDKEIMEYPRSFACCLHYLSIQGIYPDNLINHALDKDFIKHTYGKSRCRIGREIFSLDTNVRIEAPDYKGNSLNDELREYLVKYFISLPPDKYKKPSAAEKLTLEVVDHVESLLGNKELFCFGYPLPQYEKPDIIICHNNDGEHVSVKNDVYKNKLSEVKYPIETNKYKWTAIVIGGWNSTIRDSGLPLGTMAMKLRQLKKIGYHPVWVPWYEWKFLNPDEKMTYMKNKINSVFENS